MRLLWLFVAIAVIISCIIAIMYANMVQYNGKYKYDIYVEKGFIGSGEFEIIAEVGQVSFTTYWPFINHYPVYRDGGNVVTINGSVKDDIDSYLVNADETVRVYSGDIRQGVFTYTIGKCKKNNVVVINIDFVHGVNKIFLWASPWTDMKDFAYITNIRRD